MMGPFADTVFTVLLGWVRSTVQALWRLVTGADLSAWFDAVMDNWLTLVVLLCLAGVVIDLVVYLLRWQPYRVWRSFFQRRRQEKETQPDNTSYRQWLYADGSTRVEEIPAEPAANSDASDRLHAPIRPIRRAIPANGGKAYNQPVYPPQWQHQDDSPGGDE